MNKPEGIIFDCDGCLLDSEVVFLKTVVKYLKKYEIDTSLEELIFVIGKPMTVIAQEIIEKFIGKYINRSAYKRRKRTVLCANEQFST